MDRYEMCFISLQSVKFKICSWCAKEKHLFGKVWKVFKPWFFKVSFRLDFLVLKLDFEETKLCFSNWKFSSILRLTFQLLKRSRNPSKLKFSSIFWNLWKFLNFEKLWLLTCEGKIKLWNECLMSNNHEDIMWVQFCMNKFKKRTTTKTLR